MELQKTEVVFQRNSNIDALRGIAFIAVILVNLLGEFRVPFLMQLQQFHTEPGPLNHAVDWFVGITLDQKGFTILSFLFGVGISIMVERNKFYASILLRRFLFLLFLGLVHIFFVFSGDILVLYSLCGLLLIPLSFLESTSLCVVVVLLFAARIFISWPNFPFEASSAELIDGAYRFYGEGTFREALSFRQFELQHLIWPLLLRVWPRTLAVMLLGYLSWKHKWITQIQKSEFGRFVFQIAFSCGALFTSLEAYLASNSINVGRWNTFVGDIGILGLALAYSIFLIRMSSSNKFIKWLAPLGQLGLTTYLTQTILLGFIFYGYGLGLFGKIGSFSAAGLALCFYLLQLVISKIYLSKYKTGPVEYIWRKITYLGVK